MGRRRNIYFIIIITCLIYAVADSFIAVRQSYDKYLSGEYFFRQKARTVDTHGENWWATAEAQNMDYSDPKNVLLTSDNMSVYAVGPHDGVCTVCYGETVVEDFPIKNLKFEDEEEDFFYGSKIYTYEEYVDIVSNMDESQLKSLRVSDKGMANFMEIRKLMFINMKMILETERLFLREMSMDDFDALYKVLADKEIMQHYPYTFDEERVRSWIERNMNRYKDNGFGLWAVCLKETGEMIGDCGLTLQNIEGEMLPEIGYHIRRDMQRKGYAKEAASAVRDWAFANTEYPAIYSYCKYTNEGSFKTAESIGMHFCKEYPDEANGITHVSVIRREDL